jgi:hypothetical protein
MAGGDLAQPFLAVRVHLPVVPGRRHHLAFPPSSGYISFDVKILGIKLYVKTLDVERKAQR